MNSVSDNDEMSQKLIKDGSYNEETFLIRVDNVRVPQDGKIIITPPIRVNTIQIVFESPADDSTTEYNVKMKIHACFEPIGKFNNNNLSSFVISLQIV